MRQKFRALIGAGPADPAPSDHPDLAWGVDLVLRMRAQAEQAMQGYSGIDEFLELRTRLIEMHHALILVRLLVRSDATEFEPCATRYMDLPRTMGAPAENPSDTMLTAAHFKGRASK